MYFDYLKIEKSSITRAVVIQENHYYPFGMNMKGIEELDLQSLDSKSEHRWQYNGKEKEESFGLHWSSYGAREYDMQLGRFHTLDPKTEIYNSWSSYLYAGNNPIRFIDINGEGPEDVVKGFLAAMADYGTLGLTDVRNWINVDSEDAADYNQGLAMADAFMIAVSVAEIGGGTGLTGSGMLTMEVGVATLIVPGFGEVSFVIAEVAGAAEILTGIGLVAHGTYTLEMAQTNQNNKNGHRKESPSSGKNSSNQSVNGKKHDPKTGQEAGPSGKPKVHTVKNKSQKQMKDAARQGGSGTPVKHTKDQKGGHHYHSGTGKEGKGKGTKKYGSKAGKKSDNVHYEYRKK